jgi:cyanophycinase-like exopeptidase
VVEVVCLQGGAEFSDACIAMDTAVLVRAGGPVVVLASAAAQGRDYTTAGANASRYYASLGASVSVAPDPRDDLGGAVDAVRGARLVVLPGGSPSRLAEALVETALGAAVAAAHAVSGASAGAMVLCSSTVLPDVAGRPLAPGLGVVPDAVVLPHFTGSSRWIDPADERSPRLVLGLPECSGVVIADGVWRAVGAQPSTLWIDGEQRVLEVGDEWTLR